jgi:16S rRNA (cytidine1402-2'-O)-methyltransferase
MSNRSGRLVVVATPIGNLADFSSRAREVLQSADLIAAEDTRHSGRLLQHFGIHTPLLSLHEHNEERRVPALLARLREGALIALISDAGTPLVSDPGYRLVRAVQEAGIPLTTVPGPCSPVAALSVAGLPSDRFVFEGFLPARQAARRKRLTMLAGESRTMIFLETTHRIQAALQDMAEQFGGEREACIVRELTKLHEEVVRAPLRDLVQRLESRPDSRRGEFVLVVAGKPGEQADDAEARRLLAILLEDLPPARAAAMAARLTGRRRADLYALAEQLRGGGA